MLTNYVRGGAILLLLMVALSFLGSDHIAQSSTPDIIVNTTSDAVDFGGAQQVADLPGPDGLVPLREAIIAANNTAGPQLIAFNIPTGDPGFDGSVFTIRPLNQLPYITGDRTTIDGSTQTSFSGNTNAVGPEVVLDGSLLDLGTGPAGLHIRSADNYIHSLVVHSFWSGIENGGPSALRNVITGCFVGTDAAGVVARPNAVYGVTSRFGASHNRIGGPNLMDRNLISGNGVGVFVENESHFGTTGNIIEGNLIGTDVTGTTGIGNIEGIHIKSGVTDTLIVRNLIANNVTWGVLINDSTSPFSVGNRISRNVMRDNGSEPIVLMGGGDSNDPGDADIGPNNLQNFPVLTQARITPGQLLVKGAIDTPNPKQVTIEFFANPVPIPGGDSSGRGEGAIFLGTVRPNPKGGFNATLPPVPVGTLITATATDAAGNTSQFAANIAASVR